MALMNFLIGDVQGRRLPEGKEHLQFRELGKFRPGTRFRALPRGVDRNGAWSHGNSSDTHGPAPMVLTSY